MHTARMLALTTFMVELVDRLMSKGVLTPEDHAIIMGHSLALLDGMDAPEARAAADQLIKLFPGKFRGEEGADTSALLGQFLGGESAGGD